MQYNKCSPVTVCLGRCRLQPLKQSTKLNILLSYTQKHIMNQIKDSVLTHLTIHIDKKKTRAKCLHTGVHNLNKYIFKFICHGEKIQKRKRNKRMTLN